jgi:hypothetical protein
MRVFKTTLFAFLLIFFYQCKKDKKEEPIKNLLPNGKYILYLETNSQSHSSSNYYLKDNVFYVMRRYTTDTICFERKAGELFSNVNGGIELATLHFGDNPNPCVFENDSYGGDTMICHFSKITEATSNFGEKYIKGDYYFNLPSNIPYKIQIGIFTLGITK